LLDPGINRPAAINLFGGTDFTAGEATAEIEEEATGFGGVADRFGSRQLLDCRFQIEERCGAAFGSRKNGASGAKARSCCVVAARLKPCPDTNLGFPQPVKPCPSQINS